MSFPWIMCGLALGAGILLVVSGFQHRPIRPAAQPSFSTQNLPADAAKRGVQAAVCAILVLALTGWPIAALAAAVFGWFASELIGGSHSGRCRRCSHRGDRDLDRDAARHDRRRAWSRVRDRRDRARRSRSDQR